jgi:hypothetical protein
MNKKKTSKRAGGTAFVPGIVFRTLFKTAIPIVSSTILPACLAVSAYRYDGGAQNRDASKDKVPDVGEAGLLSDAGGKKKADAANDDDGAIGATDGSNGH